MNIFSTKFFDDLLDFIEKNYYIFLAVILLMSALNIFYNTGKMPIYSWDEARHGVNAYEMIKRNNYIVNTYSYKNDYWNLKPPMSFWAVIMGYKLAGFNPLGLRIFSGVSAYVTILMVTLFTFFRYGKLASIISAAVLSTTVPYILEHCARTGDPDSIFVLFFTAAMMATALMEKKIAYLYAAGIFFALAFLTKSWHAGCIVVICIIYIIASGIIFKLKLKHIILFMLSASLPIIVWGIVRYREDGFVFFREMIRYDLMARTSRTLEGHIGSRSYYIGILQSSYGYWLIIFMSTLLAASALLRPGEFNREKRNQYLLIFLWIAIPVILYSIPNTKIAWYILPVYPAMAISIGAVSNFLLRCKSRNLILQAMLSIMIIFSLYKNEALIIGKISKPKTIEAQLLFKDLEKLPEYRSKHIYIIHFEQSYFLCAELYNDLMPISGGIKAFMEDNTDNALLFITKDRKEMQDVRKYNLKVVVENKSACIFIKPK